MNSHPVTNKWLNLAKFIVSAIRTPSLKECYDASACVYENIFGRNQEFFANVMVELLREQRRGKYERALDLGAGTGILTRKLSDVCDRVCGIDFSHGMLEQAIIEAGSSQSHYIGGDVLALPFPDDEFDLVVSLGLITHILPKHFAAFVSEMDRVAAPSATILIAITPLPWRLFSPRRSSFEPRLVDKALINGYNLFQKSFKVSERRGVYEPATFRAEFGKHGYGVEYSISHSLTLVTASRNGQK